MHSMRLDLWGVSGPHCAQFEGGWRGRERNGCAGEEEHGPLGILTVRYTGADLAQVERLLTDLEYTNPSTRQDF